jgi:hypothetical protein
VEELTNRGRELVEALEDHQVDPLIRLLNDAVVGPEPEDPQAGNG